MSLAPLYFNILKSLTTSIYTLYLHKPYNLYRLNISLRHSPLNLLAYSRCQLSNNSKSSQSPIKDDCHKDSLKFLICPSLAAIVLSSMSHIISAFICFSNSIISPIINRLLSSSSLHHSKYVTIHPKVMLYFTSTDRILTFTIFRYSVDIIDYRLSFFERLSRHTNFNT